MSRSIPQNRRTPPGTPSYLDCLGRLHDGAGVCLKLIQDLENGLPQTLLFNLLTPLNCFDLHLVKEDPKFSDSGLPGSWHQNMFNPTVRGTDHVRTRVHARLRTCRLRHHHCQPPVTVADTDGQARVKVVLNTQIFPKVLPFTYMLPSHSDSILSEQERDVQHTDCEFDSGFKHLFSDVQSSSVRRCFRSNDHIATPLHSKKKDAADGVSQTDDTLLSID
ncbi:hypothetical protein T11_4361 [Trichinella zimbabwensis]|uniref:Uncharacterized protein n=1 Tax=Trichinella zimbabwensis TaxID=268475 RepID=A0A0V1HLI6_9BILA|nr:hypothetical protein T11_16066 [Trichinella zimbabwensis]KRZ11287.1 hypothetical protein T11_4361 [Trichinella zimbabwensis]